MDEILKSTKRKFHKLTESVHVLYVFGSTVPIFLSVFYIDKNATLRELVFTILVAVVFCFSLLSLLYVSYTLGRKSRYAEANHQVANALSRLKDLYHYLDECLDSKKTDKNFSEEHAILDLKAALTAFNSAFELTASVHCRTSLKIMGKIPGNGKEQIITDHDLDWFYVTTLARDESWSVHMEEADANDRYQHKLSRNSDLKSLANPKEEFYFSDDLSENHEFSCTRESEKLKRTKKNKDQRSLIVWPIRFKAKYKTSETENKSPIGHQTLYGFLTIDSGSRGAFQKRYDIALGKPVSEALYPVLHLWNKVKEKQSVTD